MITEPPIQSTRLPGRLASVLWVAVLILASGQSTAVSPAGGGVEISRLEDPFAVLTRHVAEAGLMERQDFAWISLYELIETYERVIAESTLETPGRFEDRARLTDWRAGARAFNRELYMLREKLKSAASVEIQPGGADAAVLLIDGSPLVISGPEIGAAGSVERRIIDSFCQLHPCPELSQKAQSPATPSRFVGRGIWMLDNQRPARYRTPDGLVFVFDGLSVRRSKQEACEAMAGELRMLLEGLAAALENGSGIDWERLTVRPLRGDGGSHVTVNRNGDYLRLNLPYLERTDLLESGGRDWIKGRLAGEAAVATFQSAERFLSGQGGAGY